MFTGEPWVRWPPELVQPHERVARLKQGEEHGLVHLAARIGLHIGESGAEQLLGAVDGDLFDLVDIFAAAIIAAARIALGILVGQDRTGRFKHGGRADVFARSARSCRAGG
jgi:hypothetical protein